MAHPGRAAAGLLGRVPHDRRGAGRHLEGPCPGVDPGLRRRRPGPGRRLDRRAHRPARPGRLAEGHAGHRAQGTPPPRRTAVGTRGTGAMALPGPGRPNCAKKPRAIPPAFPRIYASASRSCRDRMAASTSAPRRSRAPTLCSGWCSRTLTPRASRPPMWTSPCRRAAHSRAGGSGGWSESRPWAAGQLAGRGSSGRSTRGPA